MATLRQVVPILVAFDDREESKFKQAWNLAILSGRVATTPHMSDADRNRFNDSITLPGQENSRAKDYTDEELRELLRGAEEINKAPVHITTADGKVISGTERNNRGEDQEL